jgi:hypothetical protein
MRHILCLMAADAAFIWFIVADAAFMGFALFIWVYCRWRGVERFGCRCATVEVVFRLEEPLFIIEFARVLAAAACRGAEVNATRRRAANERPRSTLQSRTTISNNIKQNQT